MSNNTILSSDVRQHAGTLQSQRGLKALNPNHFSVEERTEAEWLSYLRRFASWLRFQKTDGTWTEDWSAFFPDEETLRQLVAWLDGNTTVDEAVREIASRPHMALLLAFLKLQRHPRDQFRRLTERHLQYYYRDVLGLWEKPAEPDYCHLLVTLDETADPLVLEAGTAFAAGVDGNDQPRQYLLEDASAISHARIQTLRTLSLDQDGDDVGFLLTDLEDEDKGLSFPPEGAMALGENVLLDSERQRRPVVGLVLGSPLLWLSEGIRVITLKLDADFAEAVQSNGLTGDFVAYFDIAISTAEGMLPLNNPDLVTVNSWADSSGLTVSLTLAPLFPPVTLAPEPPHDGLSTPWLQLTVKSDDNGRYIAYEKLHQLVLTEVELNVQVNGLRQLLLRNDESSLDPTGPVQPFGSQPRPGSRMQFSHPELNLKPLEWLSLDLDWSGKPDDVSTYYQPYRTYLGNPGWPAHQIQFGSPFAETGATSLFNHPLRRPTVENSTSYPLSDLYPDGYQWTTFSDLPLDSPEPRNWPFWYSLVLSEDDFGHSLYAPVTTWFASQHSQAQIAYQNAFIEYQTAQERYEQELAAYQSELEVYSAYQAEKAAYDDDWEDHWSQLWFTVVSKGHSSSAPRESGIYDGSGQRLYSVGNYYMVAVWDNATRRWISHNTYTLSSSAQSMANHLAGLNAGHSVVIYTGLYSGGITHTDLKNQLFRCGASESYITHGSLASHGSYLLIGRPGIGAGNGFERVSADDHDTATWVAGTVRVGSNGSLNYSQAQNGVHNYPEPSPAPDSSYNPPAAPVTPVAPVSPVEPTPPGEPVEVPQPWTPLAQRVAVNYAAKTTISVNEAGAGSTNQLLHLHPLGSQPVVDADQQSLLPSLENAGYLYIGLASPPAGGAMNLLFQLAPVDGDPALANASLRWSYLANNRWLPFGVDNQTENSDRALILGDGTNDLVDSGIITFGQEPAMTRTGGFPGDGQIWLRATIDGVARKPVAWSKLVGVHTQAVKVRFDDTVQIPDHLPEPLPSATVNALVTENVAISGIQQPYDSFGGRPVETTDSFAMRVSERLRHKGRALTVWDYEHLVLERFPELFLVNCQRIADTPYGIRILAVPRTTDPLLLKPRTPRYLQQQIRDYLEPLMPPVARLSVDSPQFQEVRFEIALTFYPEYDPGLVLQTLNDRLVARLSPWTAADSAGGFRREINVSDIVTFIEQLPFVEVVLKVEVSTALESSSGDGLVWQRVAGGVIYPQADNVILVPASRHALRALPPGSEVFEGISLMEIGHDFAVADVPVITEGVSHMTIDTDFIVAA
ncbi:hypothetical protein [Kistimonas asteriae]|uniref:hypothetical protein n=1 Tax=Kistimonas asteriae TaxID=517724 RepID=UPI001BA6ACB7|nr:hypothetical protein [Kistimonas asteriae]